MESNCASRTTSTSKLFEPIQVGNVTLNHRIALAPLTRYRANSAHVHSDIAVEYYTQRGSVPGTMLVSEATFIAAKAGGTMNVPGIYTDEQIAAWKRVTESVHSKGSFIYLQLRALGRTADIKQLQGEDPSFPYISSSDVKLDGRDSAPRPLTIPEIKEYVQLYATAADNAVHKAGFDGVEIHGANGYLVDQFIQDVCNTRTDEYGGSIENRCRFGLEVVDAVCKAIGPKKTGIRVSPWSRFQDMRMENPVPTFSYLISQIRDSHPDFAFLHVVEPRIKGAYDDPSPPSGSEESNEFLREIWTPKPFIVAGGTISAEIAAEQVNKPGNNIVAVGRYFISNPDLPARVKEGIAWAPYDRSVFYLRETPKGYIDYPTASRAGRDAKV